MFRRKKISFRETLLTKKKPDLLHAIYYEMVSNSLLYNTKIFLKYATLGIIGTLVHIGILILFTEVFNLFYLFSAIIGILAGLYVNYLLNKKYIIKERTHKQRKVNSIFTILYFGISIITIVINLWLLFVFVENFKMHYILANIISGFLMFITRYFCHRFLFKRYGH
jgi:putative flippase GtrA